MSPPSILVDDTCLEECIWQGTMGHSGSTLVELQGVKVQKDRYCPIRMMKGAAQCSHLFLTTLHRLHLLLDLLSMGHDGH